MRLLIIIKLKDNIKKSNIFHPLYSPFLILKDKIREPKEEDKEREDHSNEVKDPARPVLDAVRLDILSNDVVLNERHKEEDEPSDDGAEVHEPEYYGGLLGHLTAEVQDDDDAGSDNAGHPEGRERDQGVGGLVELAESALGADVAVVLEVGGGRGVPDCELRLGEEDLGLSLDAKDRFGLTCEVGKSESTDNKDYRDDNKDKVGEEGKLCGLHCLIRTCVIIKLN